MSWHECHNATSSAFLQVKSAAFKIVSDNDSDGIAEAVEEFIL